MTEVEPTWVDEDGYERVTLTDSFGRDKAERVDLLVASAFVPNPTGKKEVRHVNGDKLDNRAVNLEWV